MWFSWCSTISLQMNIYNFPGLHGFAILSATWKTISIIHRLIHKIQRKEHVYIRSLLLVLVWYKKKIKWKGKGKHRLSRKKRQQPDFRQSSVAVCEPPWIKFLPFSLFLLFSSTSSLCTHTEDKEMIEKQLQKNK